MRRFHTTMAVAVLLAFTRLGAPAPAAAQAGAATASPERTFGTSASVVYNIGAFAFKGESGLDNARVEVAFGSRRCSGGGCVLAAPVFLPAGALVSRLELAGCDNTSIGDAGAVLEQLTESEPRHIGSVGTGFPNTPGCGFFASDLAETIDNAASYRVRVRLRDQTRFQAVRLYYTLQISAAPATASFQDVPTTHPFFRFIEALFAAGITGGCSASPPLYCPDDPLTRGQMAVFLSRALGLHWAP
jgi:hypothetical protein